MFTKGPLPLGHPLMNNFVAYFAARRNVIAFWVVLIVVGIVVSTSARSHQASLVASLRSRRRGMPPCAIWSQTAA